MMPPTNRKWNQISGTASSVILNSPLEAISNEIPSSSKIQPTDIAIKRAHAPGVCTEMLHFVPTGSIQLSSEATKRRLKELGLEGACAWSSNLD
ncbi:hypothetical protein TNCT_138631 [Trichonephila clavata]|uniref:Uncharacterized protein n=1 Tax=Trichonephila clavata TaxID=2740835 RepID=A0A8X6LJ71_TRICU|nr:hypothetical protein TNCT_138631 [Trichonephila clavata]